MTDPAVLTVRRAFAASPERVFDAWLDPARARRFLFATPDGDMTAVEIDARVGGEALIVERRPAGEARHRLRYEAIEPPHRLVFLFAADPAAEGEWTRVTIEITAAGAGCVLTLTHEMDPAWAEYEARTREGWTMILASLADVVETDDG
ncbi:MAG TPA: SRPBCC domain-containing protein [Sphingomonas sp.]|nr:SRPBCC domain-containing protein [Sphingomonas sp.]